KKGLVDEWPSGSMDIAPTTLWILGVSQAAQSPMDGRVLAEALAKGDAPESKPEIKTIEATRQLGWLQWRQYLKYTEFNHRLYLDEGNASLEMK
ncbi:MAG: hypothetical protein NTW03_16880, partial [Verrucomicrobia bacterium]|nr:hypothetical protein [Verrucomicrobiota bacterium]